jgi:hypothetical protein
VPEVVVAPLAGEAGGERVALAAVALLLRRYTGTAEQVLSWAGGTVSVDLTEDRPFADVPPRVRPATGPPPHAEPGLPLSGVVRCALDVSGPVWTVSVPDCPAGLADPLHADLAALFAELAADPARSTADLLPVCAYERARPVVADPHPDAVLLADRIAAHRSIPAAFAAQVAEHPDRPAVLADDACLTYRELAGAVARTAAALPPGGAAALLCGHGAATVTALLAALAAGKSYVPLDPTYPRARLADILLDSDAEVLLVDAEHEALAAAVLADAGRDLPMVHIGQPGDADLTGLAGPAEPDDIAYLLYTSGSTGRPKGVVQSHRNVLFGIANHVRNFGITPEDRTSVVTSFGFDMAVTDTFGALLAGAAAVPVDIRNTVGVDLGGDAEGKPGADGDVDGAQEALLRRHAAQEGQVAPGLRLEREHILGQAVVHGAEPVDPRDGLALGVRDGHRPDLREFPVQGLQRRQVLAAVERRYHRDVRVAAREGVGQVFDMRVDDVEFPEAPEGGFQGDEMACQGLLDVGEPQGLAANRLQAGGSAGIPAGEQGDVVPQPHQLLGEEMHDPLRAPVQGGRNTLIQRRNLRYPHAAPGVTGSERPYL